MKISKFKISNGFQFDDLELDLTYPEGHEKAGKPLDKICIIGQSGTGKTTLLEEMALSDVIPSQKTQFRHSKSADYYEVSIVGKESYYRLETKSQDKRSVNYFTKTGDFISAREFNELNNLDGIRDQKSNMFIYFPAYPITNRIKHTTPMPTHFKKVEASNVPSMWKKIQSKLHSHTNERSKYAFALGAKNISEEELILRREKLLKWDDQNPSILEKLAKDYLNPILREFNLKVKTELEDLDESQFINILDQNNTIIPNAYWSSGTKQIVYKTIPLYLLNLSNSVICFDEPENSLYPDTQRIIIDLYTKFGTNCQYIFATHSPLIASNFEPWEIVELKFNNYGKVYRERYYDEEKGNHVDNYEIFPMYLKWDSILTKAFDLKNDSNPARGELLTRFSQLKFKIQDLKNEGKLKEPSEATKDLVEKFRSITKKLGKI